ncbi:AAA domain-containing protein [Pararhodonellum marinum]|uniref:AAA domain-containing protein n=1 Tax=Pararhodonellum marinum TaxID=2755358 RepID=UPI00188E8A3C|nr:AAA domain-containing protein [Pararhodonellum marinum]
MVKILDELTGTLNLLRKEWKEDLVQFQKKNLQTSLDEKKKSGICWYPIGLKRTKIAYGDRHIVEVERLGQDYSHGFQSGKSVSLFSNAENSDLQHDRVNGVINYVSGDKMVITLNGDALPDWLRGGKLGVDLLFDEASYREMESAMKAVLKAEKGRLAFLRNVVLGAEPATFSEDESIRSERLNESQEMALNKVLSANDLAIIHGPPGTGKTTTLVASIHRTLKQVPQVLVCAPSNAAVDLLVEKLTDAGVSTTRLGHPARIDEKILLQTLDAKISQHESYKALKKTRKEAASMASMAKKYKRNFGQAERAQKRRLLDEARRLKDEAAQLEDYITHDVFRQTQVVATTLVGAAHSLLKGFQFPVVFLDEAAQSLEPASWIPLLKSDKLVMAGDHCQLPPTIKSLEAAKAGLSETLFEKAIERQKESAVMLTLQYRMPDLIMGFSNQYFYKGALRAAPETKNHQLGDHEPVMRFIDTAGSGFRDQLEKDSLSTLNPEEARFTLTFLENLLKRIGVSNFKTQQWNIGLIAPYGAQVRKFKELVFQSYEFPNIRAFTDLVQIDTIDGFQGQERDLMIISLVRSNDKGEIGFLADIRRMNVALTRAKRKLVVIGDSSTLSQNAFYAAFLDYVEANQLYESVYEYLNLE